MGGYEKGLLCAVAAALLFPGLAYAGWGDLSYSSPESYQDFHQGRPISLSLNVTNTGHTDGYAVYILNVTLNPPDCMNGGRPITSSGVVLCPRNDSTGCINRHREAGSSAVFNFTDIPSDPDCINGLRTYNFTLEGSTELLGYVPVWSAENATTTQDYFARFTGPDVCGDSVCAPPVENCTTCEEDCGRCTECAGNARTCLNNSVMGCSNGFFTHLVEACRYGCLVENETPKCRRICTEGEKQCANATTLQTCINNEWQNETCLRGCVNDACESNLCAGVRCPDKCEGGTAYSYGSCSPSSGGCTYYGRQNCTYGCSGIACAAGPATTTTPSPTPQPGIPCCGSIAFILAGLMLAAFRR